MLSARTGPQPNTLLNLLTISGQYFEGYWDSNCYIVFSTKQYLFVFYLGNIPKSLVVVAT